MFLLRFFVILTFSIFAQSCGGKGEKAFVYSKSQSKGQWNSNEPWRFSPEFLIDGKASTAFCGDSKNSELSFTLEYLNSFQLKALEITNGFAKSQATAAQNGQAKKLKVTVLEQKLKDGIGKIEGQDSVVLELKPVQFIENQASKQVLELEKTLVGNTIHIEILDSFPGSKYAPVCLSEIRFGESSKAGFQAYPIQNEEDVRRKISDYEEGSKHYFAFKKLISWNEKGPVNFLDSQVTLPVFFKGDDTFSFGETLMTRPDEPSQPNIQGKYTVVTSGREGVEITLSYFDSSGMERSDSWLFKRAVAGDEDFETFKTKLGPQFSEVFDPKTSYLLFLKAQGATYLGDKAFYNYEIPLK